jgi:subtilisin family serine protease
VKPFIPRASSSGSVRCSLTLAGRRSCKRELFPAVTSLVAALAPHAKIISIKCIAESGTAPFDIIAHGIEAAVDRKVQVLLVPLGAREVNPTVEALVSAALRAGMPVVAPVGNDGENRINFPAKMPGVLSAGATDHSDHLLELRLGSFRVCGGARLNGEKQEHSGTSFSSAVAAAIAAETWAARRDYDAEQLKKRLIQSADDVTDKNDEKSDGGRVRRINGIKAIAVVPAN